MHRPRFQLQKVLMYNMSFRLMLCAEFNAEISLLFVSYYIWFLKNARKTRGCIFAKHQVDDTSSICSVAVNSRERLRSSISSSVIRAYVCLLFIASFSVLEFWLSLRCTVSEYGIIVHILFLGQIIVKFTKNGKLPLNAIFNNKV
jgi:hypothetical protein